MLTWLSFIAGVLEVMKAVVSYAEQKGLINAGMAKAGNEAANAALARIKVARDARRNTDHSPDSVRNDKYNRRNR